MAYARVVEFDGVDSGHMARLREEIQEGGKPEGLPATELVILHDASGERAVAIMFFETEEDYRQGDAVMDAMPAADTPGRRASVTKYDVAVRVTA